MPKGISIHIGLNYVDAAHYGSKNKLPYCDNDAFAMRALAHKEGYAIQDVLLNEEATVKNILHALDDAADSLHAGDILLLTYSGHGSQFPDLNGDEEDKFDEAWVLYDRLLLDDELYYAWSKFGAGVRILLISDSCHAGTVAKEMVTAPDDAGQDKPAMQEVKADAERLYKRHKDLYDRKVGSVPSPKDLSIAASVILLASCQDKQSSISRARSNKELSLFTDELLKVYEENNQAYTYASFLEAVSRRIPKGLCQTPSYYTTGVEDRVFARQTPFTI